MRANAAALAVLTVGFFAIAAPAVAQRQRGFEIEGGFGHTVSDVAPMLPAVDIGLVYWVGEHAGFAVSYVHSLGDDRYGTPKPGGDRTWLGQTNLRYGRVTFRWRAPLVRLDAVEFGFGLLLGGGWDSLVFWEPDGPEEAIGGERFVGYSLELLFKKRLTDSFAIKAGATLDFNLETSIVYPVVMGSWSF